jgi:hypothetical protein
MTHVVQPGTGVRHRLIFELRYDRGELYWDRCGRVARALAAKPGWALQSIDLNGCHIWNEDQNLILTYSATKLDLTQSQNRDVSDVLPPGEFAVIGEEFSEAVVQALEVKSFPRIGFRLLTLYATDTVEDASLRINRMSFFSPSKALTELGGLSGASHSVVVTRSEHMVRVAATPFEQQVRLPPSVIASAKAESHKHEKGQDKILIQKLKAKKAIEAYPAAGMMIDLDAYIEDVPYPEVISVRTFVEGAMRDFDTIRDAILSEEGLR